MIQSKYKFLPILYIRKCKITYLKCFAIELMNVGWRQPTPLKSMTLQLHTTYECQEYMDKFTTKNKAGEDM